MFRKIFSIAIIFLCLWLISCGEINNPILPEEPTEKFFDGQIRITCDHMKEYSGAYAWGGPYVSKISRVLVESDIIFVGKSIKISGDRDSTEVDIEITEVLKGATNERRATLVGTVGRDYDFYEGNVFIICICKDGDVFVFPTATNKIGRLSVIVIEDHYNDGTPFCYYEELDDIKLLLNAYKKNKELFSKSGKRNLVNLYPKFKGYEVKTRVLDDLADLVDEQDVEFLLAGLKSGYFPYELLSMRTARNLKIEQLKEPIANLLITIPYIPANERKIFHLLLALGAYGDIKYKDLFFKYFVDNEDQVVRSAAVLGIGQLPDQESWLALVPYYGQLSGVEREDIINMLEKIQDNDILIPVLLELRQVEIEKHGSSMLGIIDKIIAKRLGRG